MGNFVLLNLAYFQELSHVLAETDRAIANVKDLFGDDPMVSIL